MKASQPFARSHAMMAAISAAMSLAGSFRHAALASIPAYKSRGHGRSFSLAKPRSKGGSRMASVRAARKARNVRRFRATNK